jgi:hypothetical protein
MGYGSLVPFQQRGGADNGGFAASSFALGSHSSLACSPAPLALCVAAIPLDALEQFVEFQTMLGTRLPHLPSIGDCIRTGLVVKKLVWSYGRTVRSYIAQLQGTRGLAARPS